MKTQYRIVGRFAKDEKTHVVDWDPKWTKEDAERRLKELVHQNELDKQRGCHVNYVGCIGVSTPYYSEYELMDLRIQSREVSEWS